MFIKTNKQYKHENVILFLQMAYIKQKAIFHEERLNKKCLPNIRVLYLSNYM